MKTVDVLGVPVVVSSPEVVARAVVERAARRDAEGPARMVAAASVHTVMTAVDEADFRQVLRDAWIVTPDGMPLVWAGRLQGAREMGRVYGPDLVLNVCRISAASHPEIPTAPGSGALRRPLRHFFYGGAEGVPEELARVLQERYPGLAVAGTFSPPYRSMSEADLDAHGARIRDSGADVVWVGLGSPKQERWMHSMRERLSGMVLCSVGAAFDFHTGRAKQAPPWMGRMGLEWVFRLATEPRRLWRRYLYYNPRFVGLAVRQLVMGKVPGGDSEG